VEVATGFCTGLFILKPRIAGAADWQEAVGFEPRETRTRILAKLPHNPVRTFREYRRRVDATAAQLPITFSWATQLPPHSAALRACLPSQNLEKTTMQ